MTRDKSFLCCKRTFFEKSWYGFKRASIGSITETNLSFLAGFYRILVRSSKIRQDLPIRAMNFLSEILYESSDLGHSLI